MGAKERGETNDFEVLNEHHNLAILCFLDRKKLLWHIENISRCLFHKEYKCIFEFCLKAIIVDLVFFAVKHLVALRMLIHFCWT
jgi:hypothetical protein